MKTIRVLTIEDSNDDYILIRREIKSNYDCISKRVETVGELQYNLHNSHWDLIICDNALPQLSAKMAIGIVREFDSDIPFILVSGTIGEEYAVKLVKLGVNDYVMKDNLSRLMPTIDRELKEADNRKKKKEAENDLATLIYRSSHDLKGPVASMKGLINLLRNVNDAITIKESIGHLDKSVQSLSDAIQHLLNIYKIKEIQPEKVDFNFRELMQEIINGFRFMAGFEHMTFKLDIADDCTVKCDAYLLRSVLGNLVENAIKYQSPLKKPEVTITMYCTDSHLNIAMRDNGPGIDESLQNRVFEMFFRGTTDSSGNGLGLYITRHGVKKLGGEISLTSIKGRGSLFKITIEQPERVEKEAKVEHRAYMRIA